jgi:hypothetical protein
MNKHLLDASSVQNVLIKGYIFWLLLLNVDSEYAIMKVQEIEPKTQCIVPANVSLLVENINIIQIRTESVSDSR